MTLAWLVRSLGYSPSTANICVKEGLCVCVYTCIGIFICVLY